MDIILIYLLKKVNLLIREPVADSQCQFATGNTGHTGHVVVPQPSTH